MDIDKQIEQYEKERIEVQRQLKIYAEAKLRLDGAILALQEYKNANSEREENVESIDTAKAKKAKR